MRAAVRRAQELIPIWPRADVVRLLSTAMDQFDQGEAEARLALKLDPLSLNHTSMTGWLFYFARRYGPRRRALRAIIELEPSLLHGFWGMGGLSFAGPV